MGWTTVETPNAKYVIAFEIHSREARVPDTQIDGFVLEWTGLDSFKVRTKAAMNEWTVYKRIIQRAQENRNPVYFGDALPVADGTTFPRIAGKAAFFHWVFGAKWAVGMIPTGLAALLIPGKEIKKRKALLKLRPLLDYNPINPLNPKIFVRSRNALIAEKCESFIAPRLQKKLGHKPTICVIYGAGHGAGIAHLLQDPHARRRTLSHFDPQKMPDRWAWQRAIEMNYTKKDGWEVDTFPGILTPIKQRSTMKIIRARARLARMKMKRMISSPRKPI